MPFFVTVCIFLTGGMVGSWTSQLTHLSSEMLTKRLQFELQRLRLLLFLLRLPTNAQQLLGCEGVAAHVISSLQDHFWSGCVYFIESQPATKTDLMVSKEPVVLQRFLSKDYIPTATPDINHLNSTASNFVCQRNQALNVVIARGEYTRHHLMQVFSLVHPSSYIWVLLLNQSANSLENLLKDVNIPFDCLFLVAVPSPDCETVDLREIYRVMKTRPLQVVQWGNWTRLRGLQTPALSFYKRRTDFQGITLAAPTIPYLPFYSVETNEDGSYYMKGVVPELCYDVAKELNFSLAVVPITADIMTMFNENMINLTITDHYMTMVRQRVLEFSVPLFITKCCILIRTPDARENKWYSFLLPFSLPLWLTLGGTIIFTSCYMTLMYRVIRLYFRCDQKELDDFSLKGSLLCFWGSFCSQGHSSTPKFLSGRIIQWTGFVLSLIVLTAYSADFISILTFSKPVLPFTDLRGLLENDEYDFGVPSDNTLYPLFEEAKDPIMRQIFEKKLRPNKNNLPKSEAEWFRRLCEEKYTFQAECSYLSLYDELIPCHLTMLPRDYYSISSALLYPKRSPYRKAIDVVLKKMLRAGHVRRQVHARWFKPRSYPEEKPQSVELRDVAPLFCFYGISGLLGATLPIMYHLWCNFVKK